MKKLRECLGRPVNGYSVVVVLVVAISLTVASLILALGANRNSDRKLCKMAASNAAVYKETPPTTATGRNAAENWQELLRTLHCPPVEGNLK